MTLEYVNNTIYMGPSNNPRMLVYYSYIKVDTWRFGYSYTKLMNDNIRMKHCYSILILFTKIFIHNNIVTENTDIVHIDTIRYSYQR